MQCVETKLFRETNIVEVARYNKDPVAQPGIGCVHPLARSAVICNNADICIPVVHQVRICCEEFVFVVALCEVVDHGCPSYAIVESCIHPYSSDSVNKLIFGSNVKGSNLINSNWCVIPSGFNFHRGQKCSCKRTIIACVFGRRGSHKSWWWWWGIGNVRSIWMDGGFGARTRPMCPRGW